MSAHTANPGAPVTEFFAHLDCRSDNQTPVLFSWLYPGMSTGQMLLADSVATNLHPAGSAFMKINRSVTRGMDMALFFVDLPGAEEPLCMAQSQVA